jgi:hypothetical protein
VTAVSVVPFRNLAHIAIDGCGLSEKVFLLPEFPAAIVCRSPSHAAAIIGPKCREAFSSFDGLVDNTEAVFPDWCELCHRSAGDLALELYLVGWSKKRRRAEAYGIGSDEEPKGKLQEIRSVVHAPWPPQLEKGSALKLAKSQGIRDYIAGTMGGTYIPRELSSSCQLLTVGENELISRILRR